jgi:hypothetical protein
MSFTTPRPRKRIVFDFSMNGNQECQPLQLKCLVPRLGCQLKDAYTDCGRNHSFTVYDIDVTVSVIIFPFVVTRMLESHKKKANKSVSRFR